MPQPFVNFFFFNSEKHGNRRETEQTLCFLLSTTEADEFWSAVSLCFQAHYSDSWVFRQSGGCSPSPPSGGHCISVPFYRLEDEDISQLGT